MIRLGVKDTGRGIPDDKKDKLFKPFERFDIMAEQIEGTGIGLTISKQIIEMMSGKIGFADAPGKGSFFYIDVPVFDADSLSTQIKDQPELTQPSLMETSKRKVLYVEDIPANVELVKQILIRNRPYIELISASNGLEGIQLAQAIIPDLILMDINMPEIDGPTAFKKLQTIDKVKNIPVIALTADAMDSDIEKALTLGFKDYITKPIDIEKFIKTIDGFIAKQEG